MRTTAFFTNILALGLSTSSVSATPTNFTLTAISSFIPSGWSGNIRQFGFTVMDPETGSQTACNTNWDGKAQYRPRAMWLPCNDKTFHFKLNAFHDGGQIDVEIKHQYKDGPLPCDGNRDGEDCTTTRAAVSIRDGWHESESASGFIRYTLSSATATVFSSCTNCGVRSGNY